MKILFIQYEFNQFSDFISLAYHCSAGIPAALRERGHEVDCVLMPHTARLELMASREDYDLALIDVVHGLCRFDSNTHQIPISPLLTLKQRGIPIAGLVIETLFHESDEHVDAMPRYRLQAITQSLLWLDALIAFDRNDAALLRSMGARVLWAPFSSSHPVGEDEVNFSNELVFVGTMYGKRQRFLQQAGLADQIKAGRIAYPSEFGDVHQKILALASANDALLTEDLFEHYRQLKYASFAHYTQFLKHLPLIINLPSIFRGIACRTVESLWLGRIVVSPRPRHPEERRLQDRVPHVLYQYDEHEPGSFADAIKAALNTGITPDQLEEVQTFLRGSPFDPLVQASNIVSFVSRSQDSQAIEQSYFRAPNYVPSL
jgi:hypothetical protein